MGTVSIQCEGQCTCKETELSAHGKEKNSQVRGVSHFSHFSVSHVSVSHFATHCATLFQTLRVQGDGAQRARKRKELSGAQCVTLCHTLCHTFSHSACARRRSSARTGKRRTVRWEVCHTLPHFLPHLPTLCACHTLRMPHEYSARGELAGARCVALCHTLCHTLPHFVTICGVARFGVALRHTFGHTLPHSAPATLCARVRGVSHARCRCNIQLSQAVGLN
jgi:hypothetical protein